MARLTVQNKFVILEKEVTKKFYDKIEAAKKDVKDKLQLIASETVPKWITEEMIRSRYMKMSCDVNFSWGEFRTDYYDNRKRRILIPSGIHSSLPCQAYGHSVDFKRVKILVDKIIELDAEREEFKIKLRSVLNSFTTNKKLVENIPEFKHYFSDTAKQFAIVPTEAINEVRKLLKKESKL